MMDYHKSYWVVTDFYNDCLKSHMREGKEGKEAHKFAYADVKTIKNDPFSPQGEELDTKAVEDVKKMLVKYHL